ncbi:MAG TPA: AdeC/AdeK/OprM family multidrug efflux complex outer membrane factor [Deltaproteobacteria bacterium]|nr:AdeC/AdeK/OprM family multidrug efflux complex outer membrane factor [Deltaproteobacteria bacterium]
MRNNRYAILALTLLLPGCTMAPKYERPAAPVPDNWAVTHMGKPAGSPQAQSQTAGSLASIKWREYFVDSQLQRLIELALANNRDLRVAALNIEKSRAQYQIKRADLLPTINATGSGTVQRIPASLSSSGRATISRQYNVNLGMSAYELDFFGRVQSLKDQALEQYLATEHAKRSAQTSLVAEVASSYLTLAADRERLKLARDTYDSQLASYQLIQRRFEVGASSELDLRQAQTGVESARVDVARYTSLVAQDQNALAVVIGMPVPSELFPEKLSEVVTVKELQPGLPSELMQRRPDILQAEGMLKAANANIGAARAAFFPKVTLNTNIGTSSDQLAKLFAPGSAAWLFAPQISVPIFDTGRNIAGLKVSEVERDIALAQYEKAIQNAFREVSDALTQKGTLVEQINAQKALTEATSESYRLAEARYKAGISSYLYVLDSQRSFYSASQSLISTNLSRLVNLVTLYKVLGGSDDV